MGSFFNVFGVACRCLDRQIFISEYSTALLKYFSLFNECAQVNRKGGLSPLQICQPT